MAGAATLLSVVCKILVIALASSALLSSKGKCTDIPDCDNWCKSPGGYPKGGRCVPPLYQFCCCIERSDP
ncbi:hypothetical protein BRADI_1g31763v3 [Brachypodium distachyon]|uniref:Knottin scorpion toxin-like domain-containing protein n=1 Tax=Brachypodium distachyon TaxID=15368 RepID=A0A0Q3H239_BRADI|nr:hypothetical protein BRADI_1g31763v3 [Brachypodium distachyon]